MAPNPSELLEEASFSDLLKELRNTYDYIILDTPPLGSVTDAAIVAKECDGAVLVIESERVSYKLAQKVQEQLEKTGCKILGAVLNKVNIEKDKYYQKYDYYYGNSKKRVKGREDGMKRNRKTAWAWNLLLVLVCIALAVCFGGLLAWDAKAEAVRSEKLMQEAKKDKKQEVKQEVKKDKKKEEVKKEEKEPAKPISLPQGISFWGDEFFTAENELQYSSSSKIRN